MFIKKSVSFRKLSGRGGDAGRGYSVSRSQAQNVIFRVYIISLKNIHPRKNEIKWIF
jgi:hypothetical protein